MTIKFRGLFAPTDVPTGDGRMFAPGMMTHRPCPLPLLARFSSGGHDGATVVGHIDEFVEGPGGYWASGEFLDPTIVPEVPKAIYMIQHKVMGPSVDLDRDFTVEQVPHPVRPERKAALFKEYNVIGTTLVPMPAFHQVHMSIDNDEEKALLASVGIEGIDVGPLPEFGALPEFHVNDTNWQQWPIAPRNYTFDADDAVKRIAYWAGIGSREPSIDKYASTFLWRRGDEAGDSLAQDSFRLPLADIINGEPHLIYHAVYSAAALLSGAHGGLPQVSDDEKAEMALVISDIYAYLAEAFQDPNLKSPFEMDERQGQAAIDSEEFATNSFVSQVDDAECGCDLSPGETGEMVPNTGVTAMAQTITVGEGTPGTFTVSGGNAIQSITFNMMPSMPTTMPNGMVRPGQMSPGMVPSETIVAVPADVLKSMEEEKKPWGPDGCHFNDDGQCMACGY